MQHYHPKLHYIADFTACDPVVLSEIQSALDVCPAGRWGKNCGVWCVYFYVTGIARRVYISDDISDNVLEFEQRVLKRSVIPFGFPPVCTSCRRSGAVFLIMIYYSSMLQYIYVTLHAQLTFTSQQQYPNSTPKLPKQYPNSTQQYPNITPTVPKLYPNSTQKVPQQYPKSTQQYPNSTQTVPQQYPNSTQQYSNTRRKI